MIIGAVRRSVVGNEFPEAFRRRRRQHEDAQTRGDQ
jgi:hypothetical protein